MPLITNVDFDADYEDHPVPESVQDLTIIQAKEHTSKEGNDGAEVMIRIDGAEAPPIFYYLTVPSDDHPYKKLMTGNIVRFYALFGLDSDAEPEDFAGATAKGVLITQETSEEYGTKNVLSLPR